MVRIARIVSLVAVATSSLLGAGCARALLGHDESPTDEFPVVQTRIAQAFVAGKATGAADVRKAARWRGLGAGLRLGQEEGPETPLDNLLAVGDVPLAGNGLCPPDMASIDDRYCIDRFEASLVEMTRDGRERPFSPYQSPEGRLVRAVSERGVVPQAYISGDDAALACARSGKRLCGPREWRTACKGPASFTWGYGQERETGRCNDNGRSAMGSIYGAGGEERAYWSMTRMNNPELNQVPGTLSATGEHEGCTNEYGVYDMVGNVHEWVDDPKGTFQGGYYLDTTINGDGCDYRTKAHKTWYHDYSTGFRCCSDVAP